MTSQGALPYAGTSGWSGSQSSYDRAIADDTSGTTNKRQKQTLSELYWAGHDGLTWKELATSLHLHHGQASGVLSVLHKTGDVLRLKERRNRCAIYILPQFVNSRITEEHGNTKSSSDANKLVDLERYVDFLKFNNHISDYVYQGIKEILNRND